MFLVYGVSLSREDDRLPSEGGEPFRQLIGPDDSSRIDSRKVIANHKDVTRMKAMHGIK